MKTIPAARPAPDRPSWRPSLLAGALALVAYLALAPDALGDKDAAEFTLVLGAGGVAHPSGYPLYTLLGHPFVLLVHALGAGWAYAANAWSALGGAVAVALLHRLGLRLAAPSGAASRAVAWAAWAPALLFGLDPIWTYETTLAETGSWHVAWAAWTVLLALRLREGLDRRDAVAPRAWRRGALAWGLACGAGLAHHLTALLLLAPLTAMLLLAVRAGGRAGARAPWPALAAAVLAGALLPLASYGWIAWRAFHPGAAQWSVLAPSWGAVLDHLTAAQYRGYFGAFEPSPGQAGNLARYVYPLLALGAAAMALAIRGAGRGARRALLVAVAAGLALQVLVTLSYGVPDPGSYFLPVLGLSLAALAPAAAGRGGGGGGANASRLAAGVLVASLAVGAIWVKVNLDRRAGYLAHQELLRGMWESVKVDEGFVVWSSDMWHALRAWQVLDGEKPGLVVLNPATITHPWPRAQFTKRHGFDPLEGLALPAGAPRGAAGRDLAAAITARINEQSPLPVIVFDMAGPSVRMLRKAGAP